MGEQINSVDFWVEELTHDINPEHFNHNENFIPYMHDEKISSFGDWMWNNGYNVGLYNLQTKINTYCAPQWISVKDRLPETIDDVIVCNEYGTVYSAWYNNNNMWVYALTDVIITCKITHWMPMPKPPKESAE